MILSIALIVFGLALLVLGGETLLKGAVGLATVLRLTPAVIGLTVVAAGTSVPELAVSGVAAIQNKVDIAVANVIGSNIFNIGFVVAVCALVRPLAIAGNTIRLEYPVLALVTLLCVVIGRDGVIDQMDAVLCVAVYVAFTAYLVSLVRGQITDSERTELREEVDDRKRAGTPSTMISIVYLAIGVALLTGGAQSTVTGAADLARRIGWSDRVIGLTIVSIGTGLPEVVASIIASLRGRVDVALGNVIGSCLFNILGILGLTALIAPLPVQAELIANDLWWMLGITLLLFPVMFTGSRVNRIEGALLLAVYSVYITLILMSPGDATAGPDVVS